MYSHLTRGVVRKALKHKPTASRLELFTSAQGHLENRRLNRTRPRIPKKNPAAGA